jgi:hypothetical protein
MAILFIYRNINWNYLSHSMGWQWGGGWLAVKGFSDFCWFTLFTHVVAQLLWRVLLYLGQDWNRF